VTTADLIRDLEDSYQRALVTLELVDPEQVIYEESGWRVKDIVAHVATWDAESLRSIYAHRRGSAYSIPNFGRIDDFNAYAAHARMDEPMARIMADWDATAKWLHLIARALTAEDLTAEMTHPSGSRGQVGVLLQEVCEHRQMHLDDIRAALTTG
jgi:hypothetical protein